MDERTVNWKMTLTVGFTLGIITAVVLPAAVGGVAGMDDRCSKPLEGSLVSYDGLYRVTDGTNQMEQGDILYIAESNLNIYIRHFDTREGTDSWTVLDGHSGYGGDGIAMSVAWGLGDYYVTAGEGELTIYENNPVQIGKEENATVHLQGERIARCHGNRMWTVGEKWEWLNSFMRYAL